LVTATTAVPPIVKSPILLAAAPSTAAEAELIIPVLLLVILKFPPVRLIPAAVDTPKLTPSAKLVVELIVPELLILTVPPVWIKPLAKTPYIAPLNAVEGPIVLVLVMFIVPPAIEVPPRVASTPDLPLVIA
jgi:hypothetical protein